MANYAIKSRESQQLVAVSSKTIVGSDVMNRQGKSLGQIKDLAIDWEAGSIAYAVLSYSSFLGIGKKLFAIPWAAFAMEDREPFLKGKEGKLILNVPEEALKESDGFDEDNWPRQPDYTWLEQVYSRYGFKPYWERR